jgi:hypothetical protein
MVVFSDRSRRRLSSTFARTLRQIYWPMLAEHLLTTTDGGEAQSAPEQTDKNDEKTAGQDDGAYD